MSLRENVAKMLSETMFVLKLICCKKSKERVETLEIFFFSPPWCHEEETGGGVKLVPMEYEAPIVVLED